MKQELDEKLCAEFPLIYRDRRAPMTQTCMCWGFSCGDGWYGIIHGLSRVIDNSMKAESYSCEAPLFLKPIVWLARRGLFPWSIATHCYRPKTRKMGSMVIVDQVKEKFGTLRFYYHFEPNPSVVDPDPAFTLEQCNEIEGAVRMACAMSARTCEECGNPGRSRGGGWVYVRCDSCCEKEGIPLESAAESEE